MAIFLTMDPQVMQLSDELDKLVERFRQEYDLSYAAVVGALLVNEAADREDEV